MGQGGYLTLVNGTNRAWIRSGQTSYQMDRWNLPVRIEAHSSAKIYIEWQHTSCNPADDSGEAYYCLDGNEKEKFQIQARSSGSLFSAQHDLRVQVINFNVNNIQQNKAYSLGWNHDGNVYFILFNSNSTYYSSIGFNPSSWMQDFFYMLADKTPREFCMPGTHDAGMSVYTSGTPFATKASTLTQSKSIKQQLELGSRYFDIRPVISAGNFMTGHYGNILDKTWQGANGQSIASIINDINDFAKGKKELIILNLSHTLNTDEGNQSYREFKQSEWDLLFKQLSKLNHLYKAKPADADLTTIKLREYISTSSAVLVIVEGEVALGKYKGQGFYLYESFNAYNQYSNTDNPDEMISNQLNKMKEFREKPNKYSVFLISWTLTQSVKDVMIRPSIIDLANTANSRLTGNLYAAITKNIYPNIIYIDNIISNDAAALSMAINSTI